MREPVFNQTGQLGIVVRDLEATVRRYVDDYGIGPWDFAQIDLGEANNYREYGQPVERSNRSAFATVGQVMWELIEPLDEEGIYARFLAEKGEGIHHVAVATANFDETVARAERENNVILSGEFSGAKFAFLATEGDLGVILEVFSFSGTPDGTRRPHEHPPVPPFRLGKVGDPVEVLAHRVRVAGVVNAACVVLLFTHVRGRGILRSSPSDDAYRAEHRASCRPPDLVDPQEVGELVDFVLRKMLQVLVLEDVNALPRQQVDVHRVEASPLLELILGRTHLQGRGVATESQSSFLLHEPLGTLYREPGQVGGLYL